MLTESNNLNIKDENEKKEENIEEKLVNESKEEHTIKLLLNNKIAWSMSSRNENHITWMTELFGSRVQLSKYDDFYPGTKDRICLISGQVKTIENTLEWICRTSVENSTKEYQYNLKVLIPKTSLGNSLFVKGYPIKNICSRENIDIILPDYQDNILREICATLTGPKEHLIKACISIAEIIKRDPFNGICKNISYEEFNIYIRNKENIKKLRQYTRHYQRPSLTKMYSTPPPTSPFNNLYFNNQNHQNTSSSPLSIKNNTNCINNITTSTPPPIPSTTIEILTKNDEIHNENDNKAIQSLNTNNNDNEIKTVEHGNSEVGNPIPAVISFWRRASDSWKPNNNNNNQSSDVIVIPGFN